MNGEGTRLIRVCELAHEAALFRRRIKRLVHELDGHIRAKQRLSGELERFDICCGVTEPRAAQAAADLLEALEAMELHCKESVRSVEMEITGESPVELETTDPA